METTAKTGNLNLPNILSLIRIAASPVLIFLLISPSRSISLICAALFVAVSITDWLDGYLARKMNAVTTLGKFLDPLADKLLIVSALIMLVSSGRVEAWMVALMVGREIAVTGLRSIAVEAGVVIAASPLGKAKTVAQIVAIVPLLIHYEYYSIPFQTIGNGLFWIAFILTIASGMDYFYKFFTVHKDD